HLPGLIDRGPGVVPCFPQVEERLWHTTQHVSILDTWPGQGWRVPSGTHHDVCARRFWNCCCRTPVPGARARTDRCAQSVVGSCNVVRGVAPHARDAHRCGRPGHTVVTTAEYFWPSRKAVRTLWPCRWGNGWRVCTRPRVGHHRTRCWFRSRDEAPLPGPGRWPVWRSPVWRLPGAWRPDGRRRCYAIGGGRAARSAWGGPSVCVIARGSSSWDGRLLAPKVCRRSWWTTWSPPVRRSLKRCGRSVSRRYGWWVRSS